MTDGFRWPRSELLNGEPDATDLDDLAEDALQAFFAVVCGRLDDWYAPEKTWGDETPGEYVERRQIALRWIAEHATNNAAVCRANEEEES